PKLAHGHVFRQKPLEAAPEIDSGLTIHVSSPKIQRDGNMDEVIIVGAGIGGLTFGLALHGCGIPCRIFESAAEIKAVGVGINLLPHATKELAALGLEQTLAKVAIATTDATFFNRFGQLIYQEPIC